MAGHHIGLELLAHGLGQDYGVKEDGGLCHFCLTQVLFRAIEHKVRDAEAEYLVCLLKHGAGGLVVVIQVLAHSYELGSLTGKYKCFHNLILLSAINIYCYLA